MIFFIFYFPPMNELTQIQNIERSIAEILAACRNDPAKSEIAQVNFDMLITTMKKFDLGPKYYNAILEDYDSNQNNQMQTSFQMQVEKRGEPDTFKFPIIAELEKIYHKKLIQRELQLLGTKLSQLTGLKLNRDTKRNKVSLLNWFTNHWQNLHSKIYEFQLDRIEILKEHQQQQTTTNPENPPIT